MPWPVPASSASPSGPPTPPGTLVRCKTVPIVTGVSCPMPGTATGAASAARAPRDARTSDTGPPPPIGFGPGTGDTRPRRRKASETRAATEDTPGASRPSLSPGACGVNRISTTAFMLATRRRPSARGRVGPLAPGAVVRAARRLQCGGRGRRDHLLGAAVASFTIDERMSRKQRLASVQR
jgi:hypothetical protein